MKKILFTLCLAAAITAAQGQIYIDSYRFGAAPAAADLLLDSFPGASAAYSLRQLDKDYTGNCLTVRRTNGDTSNIVFVSNYLDTASLKTFCGSASTDTCWVRRFYDQSGNANNLTQTTDAQQPRIVTAGVVEKDGSTVSIRFDGSNDNLNFSANTPAVATVRVSVIMVSGAMTYSSNFGRFFDLWDGTNHFQYLHNNTDNSLYSKSDNYQTGSNSTKYTTQTSPTAKTLSVIISNTGTPGNPLWLNNVSQTASPTTAVNTTATAAGKIGIRADNLAVTALNFELSECIIYGESIDASGNRSAISGNVNRFYSIY